MMFRSNVRDDNDDV